MTRNDLNGQLPDNSTPDFITIKGKEYSTNLTEIQLWTDDSWNDEDIFPLRHMKNLTYLGISAEYDITKHKFAEHNIRDISPLSGLTNLVAAHAKCPQMAL